MDDRKQIDNTWAMVVTIMILCFLIFVESCHSYSTQERLMNHIEVTTVKVSDLHGRLSDLKDAQYQLRKRIDELEATLQKIHQEVPR